MVRAVGPVEEVQTEGDAHDGGKWISAAAQRSFVGARDYIQTSYAEVEVHPLQAYLVARMEAVAGEAACENGEGLLRVANCDVARRGLPPWLVSSLMVPLEVERGA